MGKNIKERGKFKALLTPAFYESEGICDLLLGEDSNLTGIERLKKFKEHVKSHLFIDETIKETGSYIFYDVTIPFSHSNTKTCEVILYAIVHRDILDDGYSRDGYYGNRADILSEMIEECVASEDIVKKFGIGDITFDSLYIYNSRDYYGSEIHFTSKNFR